MKSNWTKAASILVLGGLLAAGPAFADTRQPDPASPAQTDSRLENEVRHKLRMLPYYGVFDNLEFKVSGDHVELYGQVTWPTLKSDAEHAVKEIRGVETVANNIKVLPLSPMDDHIRLAVYRAVFSKGGLFRDALGANPSIHIIVENGNVTLVGVVANQGDSILANIAANGVPGVFSVTNRLRIES